MTDILLFIFAVIGLTHIIVDSKIFESPREWIKGKESWLFKKVAEAIECYQCSGFWCGLFCGSIFISPASILGSILWVLLSGFAGSFLASWGASYLQYLESQIVVDLSGIDDEDEENEC